MASLPLVEMVKVRRKNRVYTKEEYQLIRKVWGVTARLNQDNISRTLAYLDYYKQFPEMEWAMLASMVSRNAGWNMTDLKSESIYQLLTGNYLKILYHTYERPNWLIFQDAYPQLLIYAYSRAWGRPLFHLLKAFDISLFMEAEWESYWMKQDRKQLVFALIINEQHVIQQPVLMHHYFKSQVFDHLLFKIEEILRLNAVLMPDREGSLFGFSVRNFRDVNQRIELGKQLYYLLFEAPESQHIKLFGLETLPTGARFDYEQFSHPDLSLNKRGLRELYPVIHHHRLVAKDWFDGNVKNHWFELPSIKDYDLTNWYRKKRKRLSQLGDLIGIFK